MVGPMIGLLIPVGGLIWLLLKRCKLGLGEAVIGMISYAAVLTLIRAADQEDKVFLGLAFAAVLTLGLGLYFGALASEGRTGWRYWHTFVCGLLMPYAIPGMFVIIPAFVVKGPMASRLITGAIAFVSMYIVAAPMFIARQGSEVSKVPD
jgi:hypothetical protein